MIEQSFPQTRQDTMPGLCSVICTTYNHANYSRAAIESIISQDFRPIEIVVVDDGSTDGNVGIIRTALEGSGVPHIIIEQENTGNVAMNANRALAAARGEFFLLTSLDDILLPACISSKMELMAADSSLVMVGNSMHAEVDHADKITKPRIPNPVFGNEDASAAELREVEFVNIGTYFLQGTAFRADMLAAIGGFEEDVAGDDLVLRTKVWNYLIDSPKRRFFFLQQPGFAYRKHTENLHRNIHRQLRTVLDWRDRYFPGRPMPDLPRGWALNYFNQCLDNRDQEALDALLAVSPEIAQIFANHRSTWNYRRRAVKLAFRRFFRLATGSQSAK
jgi:alpha-1,3-rhamnosyltransferase